MVTRVLLFAGFVALSCASEFLAAIQKQPDDEETDINESSAHTSEVIQGFIEDDISLVLVLLVLTLIAAMAWIFCPFKAVCECEPQKEELDDPLMHEQMETTKQSIRRKVYTHAYTLSTEM